MTSLVERLRADADRWMAGDMGRDNEEAGLLSNEAAATIEALCEALRNIARETSAENDAGENYRWDDREGALDFAYSTAQSALERVS